MTKVALLGVGGNNTDILDAMLEANSAEPTYDVVGYFAADGKRRDDTDLEFLGGHDAVSSLPRDVLVTGFLFGPSSFRTWPERVAGFGLPRGRFATVIHPRAYVSPTARVGHGTIILAGTTVGADARIGDHVVILQNCGISHDDLIGEFSCLTVGVGFSGSVKIGKNCFLGTNSTIGATIGEGSLIGAGTLVRQDVPSNEVWIGVPGRFLRKVVE